MARFKGRSFKKYSLIGFICALLFLLPWIYLMFNIMGRHVSAKWINTGYVLLYGAWLFGPVSALVIIAVINPGVGEDALTNPVISAAIGIFALPMWIFSVIRIRQLRNRSRLDSNAQSSSVVPGVEYLEPFAMFLFANASFYLMMLTTVEYFIVKLGVPILICGLSTIWVASLLYRIFRPCLAGPLSRSSSPAWPGSSGTGGV